MHSHKDERTRDELQALGYEKADVGLRMIAIMVFWFFAFAGIAAVITAGIYDFVVPGGVMPVVAERDKYPKEPRLQDEITVKTDIYKLRAAEAKELNGSGPSTHNKGAYHIPIDLAIKKWAEKNSGGARRSFTPDESVEIRRGPPVESSGAQIPAGGGH